MKILEEIREHARKRYERSVLRNRERRKHLDFDLQPLYASEDANSGFVPFEVMQIIFSFLSTFDLLRSVCFVCKGWNLTSSTNFIWEERFHKTFNTEMLFKTEESEEGPINCCWKRSFLSQLQTLKRWERNVPTNISLFGISNDEFKNPSKYLARERMKIYRKKVRYHPSEFNDPNDEDDDGKRKKLPFTQMKFCEEYIVVIDQSSMITLFDQKTLNPVRDYKALIYLRKKHTDQIFPLPVLEILSEMKIILAGAIFNNSHNIYMIDMKSGEILFTHSNTRRFYGVTLSEDQSFAFINEGQQIVCLDLKNRKFLGAILSGEELKERNPVHIICKSVNSTHAAVFCNTIDDEGKNVRKIIVFHRGFCVMTQNIDVDNVSSLKFEDDDRVLLPVPGENPSALQFMGEKKVKLIFGSCICIFSIVSGHLLSNEKVSIMESARGYALPSFISSNGRIAYSMINGNVYAVDVQGRKPKIMGRIDHNRAGGDIVLVDGNELSLIFATNTGGLIKRYFGPSYLYWVGMNGGNKLGSNENDEESEEKE